MKHRGCNQKAQKRRGEAPEKAAPGNAGHKVPYTGTHGNKD